MGLNRPAVYVEAASDGRIMDVSGVVLTYDELDALTRAPRPSLNELTRQRRTKSKPPACLGDPKARLSCSSTLDKLGREWRRLRREEFADRLAYHKDFFGHYPEPQRYAR